MIKKISILGILLAFVMSFATFNLFAQDSIRISGQLHNNTRFVKVVIQKFGIGNYDIVAVPINKETGSFNIAAPADIEPGIYRFRYSQTAYGDYVDVIINGKDKYIAFSIDVSLEPDIRNPIFTASDENKAWCLFHAKQNETLNAIHIKEDFLSRYPNIKDKSYQSVLKEYNKAKNIYQENYRSFIRKSPFYWAKAQAHYSQVFITNYSESPRLQLYNTHQRFWEGKPTFETLLLNTPLYTDAIINFVQYYMSPVMDFGEEEQKAGLIKCVDKIIQVFGDNDSTKEFAIKYLQLGFKELGNEEILQYIDEKYAATAQCTENDDELKKRLEGYEALKPGNQAPPISLISKEGKVLSLFDFEQDTIILVFWASWCPHCMQEMPKLQIWAKEHPKSLVLAISLDDDYSAFHNAINEFPDMLHYCDLQKWNGEIVKSYYVAATPTLFILDKERLIVSKKSTL